MIACQEVILAVSPDTSPLTCTDRDDNAVHPAQTAGPDAAAPPAEATTLGLAPAPDRPEERQVDLADIILDQLVQPRSQLHKQTVAEYARRLRDGEEPPPLDVFLIDGNLVLADGFHRLEAARQAGRTQMKVRVHKGSRFDAIACSLRINGNHGLRLTRAEIGAAIDRLLADTEWQHYTNEAIARRCGVAPNTVKNHRKSNPASCGDTHRRCQRKNGTTYTMDIRGMRKTASKDKNAGPAVSAPEDGSAEADVEQLRQCAHRMTDITRHLKEAASALENCSDPHLLEELAAAAKSLQKQCGAVQKAVTKKKAKQRVAPVRHAA